MRIGSERPWAVRNAWWVFPLAFAAVFWLAMDLVLLPLTLRETRTLVVEKGESAGSVARKLKAREIIENEGRFLFFAKMLRKDRSIRAGKHTLKRGLPELRALLDLTREGAGYVELKVRIPEGATLSRIAERVARDLGLDRDVFLHASRDPVFIAYVRSKFPRIPEVPSLEGYLFPASYRVHWSITEEEVLLDMVEEMFRRWTPDLQGRAEGLGMTLHEVLTLASIIEKEALYDFERPIISAVFHNRMRLHRPLESCATVIYSLPQPKTRLSLKDLKWESPYNTYLHRGLPPGPICSPSMESIEAAVDPDDVKYLYFVSKGDGTHFFSLSLEEHLRNQRKAKDLERAAVCDSTPDGM
jgi:UPF0755 protein